MKLSSNASASCSSSSGIRMSNSIRSSSSNPGAFTANQWQELEQQALIFKYMVSGVPIPSELIYPHLKTTNSSSSSRLVFPHHRPIGWDCYPVEYNNNSGSKKADPEPGRCRRTDGKKWRCAKEAYPDSKYCERHMHRGRNNRSRLSSKTPSTSAAVLDHTSINDNSTPPTLTASTTTSLNRNLSSGYPTPEVYSHGLNPYRYMDHERVHFLETSRNLMVANSPYKTGGYDTSSNTNYFQGYGTTTTDHQYYHNHSSAEQQCFVSGNDLIRSSSAMKKEQDNTTHDDDHETQKQLHHFFGEWPPSNNTNPSDSWLDLSYTNSRSGNI
ncbi:hypothetical protein ACFE04_021774 [Oxalis oulophora]